VQEKSPSADATPSRADAPASAVGKGRLHFDETTRSLLYRFIRDWIAPRWRELLVAGVLTAGLAAATASYPLVIKYSFDTLMKGDAAWLPYVLAAVVFVTAARSILLYMQTVKTQGIVQSVSREIQKATFAHLMHADFARLTRDSPGRLMSKLINDISFVQSATTATLNTVIRDALSVAALIGSMFYLDWFMATVVLGVYPFGVLPIVMIARRLRQNARRTQREMGGTTALLSEKLSGVRLIKTFRLENYATKRLDSSFDEINRLKMKAVRSKAKLESMLEALGGAAVAGVLALAYWRIASGTSTVGDFMGFTTALLMAAQPIRAVGNVMARIQEGLAGVESIYGILDEKPAVVDLPDARPLVVKDASIAFEDVSFAYAEHAALPAVRHFSLNVRGGSTVALVGRSGAGKSTVINLVPRLFDVSGGRITIEGQDIRHVTLASLRSAISIVSQDVTLFDDTIAANIALGRLGASREDIIAAAKAAAAHDFILAQPNGYETQIGDRGQRLSGGQRQRLALARAILKDAPILLLDEATSALDSESERLVQEALARFTRNRTSLVIAHRLSTVQKADAICVMEDGRLVELGTHAELLAASGSYANLVKSQLVPDGPVVDPAD
jgi:subfamily B ATP-binding cassette protein MsbA